MNDIHQNWTAENLEPFRQEADPLADETIKSIMENESRESVKQIFDFLVSNADIDQVEMPQALKNFFLESSALPPWANIKHIEKGSHIFSLYGVELSMILLCKALPTTYACRKGAEVLYQTGRLQGEDGNLSKFTKRLMSTSQFVINVMSSNSMLPEGNGIISAQKIRLVHASVRYFILQKGGWDSEYWGLPINQEDSAGTLLAFSAYSLLGLEEIGVKLDEKDRDAYMHIWSCVGHIMGVDPRLNPQTYEEGIALMKLIVDKNKGKSDAGRVLTQAAVDFVKQFMPLRVFRVLPEMLVNYFLGDELSRYVGLDTYGKGVEKTIDIFFTASMRVHGAMDRSKRLKKVISSFNRYLIQGLTNFHNQGEKATFYIPPSLQESWFGEMPEKTGMKEAFYSFFKFKEEGRSDKKQ